MLTDAVSICRSDLRPAVSVIIPTYKRWELLENAINSVCGQTYQDWEIIVVNDCGGEPTPRIRQLLSDRRIKYLEHASNAGLAATRNTGVQASSGKYIAYLDDDDVYYPDHLEILVTAMDENNWDIAYSLANQARYALTGTGSRLVSKYTVYTDPFSLELLWQRNVMPVNCVIHRRECLEKSGMFDTSLKLLEDWDLWLRMSLSYQFHQISITTCEFRVIDNNSSMTTTSSLDKWWTQKSIIYSKLLADNKVAGDPVFGKLLTNGITNFFVDEIEWFGNALNSGHDSATLLPLLKVIPARRWFRLLKKKTALTVNVMMGVIRSAVQGRT